MLYALAGLAFVTATVFAFGLNIGNKYNDAPEEQVITEEVEDQVIPEEEKDVVAPVQSPGNAPTPIGGALSYEDALKKYEGRRIQFDPTCKATPSQMTLKNQSEIMFDNRSDVSQTVSFDDQSFNILAFNYTIVNLFTSAPDLPYTVNMHCGNQKNVAQIFLQN